MAIYNPSSLYGGGAFKVDTASAINYILKRQAQKDAELATLDKYYTGLVKNATSKGMRSQDIPAFTQAYNNYQNFWTKNKNAILNGDTQLAMQAEKLARLPFDISTSSISALNDVKQVHAALANPDLQERVSHETLGLNEDGTPYIDPATQKYTGLKAADEPIYNINPKTGELYENPNYSSFDVSMIKFNPKLLTGKELQDYTDNSISNIKPEDLSSTVEPDPKKKGYEIPVIIKGYKKETLAKIGDAIIQLAKDPNVKATLEKMYDYKTFPIQNNDEFKKANDAFKDVYGRDVNNSAEIYAGFQIANKNIQTKDYGQSSMSPEETEKLRLKYNKAYANYTHSLSKEQQNILQTTPTPIDEFGTFDIEGTNLHFKDGYVYNADGTPYNSANNKNDVIIKDKSKIPVGVIDKYKDAGIKPILIDNVKLNVKNGVIQTISNDWGGQINRGSYVSETMRAKGQSFPTPTSAPTENKSTKKSTKNNKWPDL